MFIVTAFVMGLLVALNPCQIAINLSALTFIEQRVSTSRQRQLDCLIYTLGKALAYTLLGFAVSMAAYYGKAGSESWLNRHGDIFSTVEAIIPFILAAAGIYMFYRAFHHHDHHGESCHNSGRIMRSAFRSSFAVGFLLAFAFCPESIIMFLSVFIPKATIGETSTAIPVLSFLATSLAFAFGAGLPVVVLGMAMDKSAAVIGSMQQKMQGFQRWINIFFGCLFLIFAVIMFFID